jgi:hypothetical protein
MGQRASIFAAKADRVTDHPLAGAFRRRPASGPSVSLPVNGGRPGARRLCWNPIKPKPRNVGSPMSEASLWFRRDFPWLAPGFIHAVADDYADRFLEDLAGWGFEERSIRGDSERTIFEELGSAFAFPDYYGGSGWDSVIDCFKDVEVPEKCAVVWRRADTYANLDPKLFGEACAVLDSLFGGLGKDGYQLVLVLTGKGPGFNRP